jgi:5-oxoprolinase (ATP-hydrolysing) subunit A
MRIDLNADVGEGFDDDPLYDIVSSVNVACGGHAGDTDTMMRACDLAKARGVTIGAHPGYPDRETMGRATMTLPLTDIKALVLEQIETLTRVARRHLSAIKHVKPHGALYNEAAVDPVLALTIAEAVREAHPMLRLVGLAGSSLPAAGREMKLAVGDEAFADRRYLKDGTLAPRVRADALIEDPSAAAAQAVALAQGRPIETVDGTSFTVQATTICVHADTPGALEIARAVRAALESHGIGIAPL